jgi:diaminohydroxyphosphoribosylaminopyrimidine deaminase/5-amino-6-(5-phosphoribosylamino)uracil reductase
LFIGNEYSNRIVHQWRSEEAAILVGTNTAMLDDPALTTRLWNGPSPIRLVMDMNLRLPETLQIFNGQPATIIFNSVKHTMPGSMNAELLKHKGGTWYYKINKSVSPLDEIMKALYQLKIQSVLVEGGARLLQSFIDDGHWDEMRVLTNEELVIKEGLDAPKPENAILSVSEQIFSDTIETYFPVKEDY